MEDLKRRWSVTYTKHLKQKRKVYQDGFLDLHVSENKVKLYDECDTLLECRILKKDEVIGSGETLTFNAHIVDVGDPEGDLKPCHDSSFHVRDKKTAENPSLMHRQKFRSSLIDSGSRAINSKNNIPRRTRPDNTSPSQKLIREFRKSELQKYGPPQSSPGTPKRDKREWQVLYTTQVTQKAKKYHDGFLQLETCGSLGRQIMLYDATRKLLDSRFLKKDEIIRSGESILYDTHLVDIGEPEEDCKPLEDLVIRGSNGNILGKREATPGQQNCVQSSDSLGGEFKKTECKHGAAQSSLDTTSTIIEWQVMYTTQMTQKAKKYHEGFLQLKTCGSLGRQVMLYDACRKLLNSRFLKKDEMINSGESISFGAHLVDIGDPERSRQPMMDLNVQGINYDIVSRPGAMYRKQDCLEADTLAVKGKPQNRASSREDADSNANIYTLHKIKLTKNITTNKPLRDACQILSVLQRPRGILSVTETGMLNQSNLNIVEAETKWQNEASASGTSSAFAYAISLNDESKNPDELKDATEVADCPSFDLGF